ncbi:MAG: hypothetical protein EOO61_03280 [Hymenobacter sp.]|nr:MAG: hypothetical protein EOO61_03280 [Hymenobacter sp.]
MIRETKMYQIWVKVPWEGEGFVEAQSTLEFARKRARILTQKHERLNYKYSIRRIEEFDF